MMRHALKKEERVSEAEKILLRRRRRERQGKKKLVGEYEEESKGKVKNS